MGRIKSTGEKNIPRKRKSKKDKKAECLRKDAELSVVKGTWLGGRTEAFCFSFIYPSAGREKRIRNIPGRKNSTDEKKSSGAEKKQEG